MSGVGEVIGIIACVAGVVSAYHDGGAIIRRIKGKRAERRAPPPPRLLEDSIDQAPGDIEREKQRGIQRFGKAFSDGDHIAVIALQQITIRLQGSLLDQLRKAAFDDEVKDFTYLVDEADLGRDRTVDTLIQLRQRLFHASPINDLSPTSTLTSTPSLAVGPGPEDAPPAASSVRHWQSLAKGEGASREASGEEDAASGAESGAGHRKRPSSLFGIFNRHHRSHSHSDRSGNHSPTSPVGKEPPAQRSQAQSPTFAPFQPPTSDARARARSISSAQSASFAAQQQQPTQLPNQFQNPYWEDNPADIWGQESTTSPHNPSLAIPPEHGDSTARVQQPSPISPADTACKPSATTASLRNTGTPIPTPTQENNYLGFCKSAARLQNGDKKAMEKRKEFNDGWSSSNVYFLGCASSKCAFAGRIPLDRIWTKVFVSEAKGVKLRWAFLAKSHVSQLKAREEQFAYQCPFCVLLGLKMAVMQGTECFIDHLRLHRGQPLGEVVLYKTRCVNDREAGEDEEFDINLLPLVESVQLSKQSEVLSDELLGLGLMVGKAEVKARGNDSMFSANEPWNEGLSDFHRYDDGFKRSEMG